QEHRARRELEAEVREELEQPRRAGEPRGAGHGERGEGEPQEHAVEQRSRAGAYAANAHGAGRGYARPDRSLPAHRGVLRRDGHGRAARARARTPCASRGPLTATPTAISLLFSFTPAI